MQLHSLSLHPSSLYLPSTTKPYSSSSSSSSSSSPSPNPYRFIKFRTSHRENLRYLKALGIVHPDTKPSKLPLPNDVDRILVVVNFLKSKGFSDADFSRLAFLCPDLFHPKFDPTNVEPVFEFLATNVSASPEESCGLILRCPDILFSDVEYCLRPTLNYLTELGIKGLNSATTQNAHLLNMRVDKLRGKLRFLRNIGLSYDESSRVCARLPSIFGYSIDDNLRPKYEYLVWEMERSLEELKKFPQYFAFSLEKRIRPRHIHLKQRNVRIPLNRMLLWGDQRFYAKWK